LQNNNRKRIIKRHKNDTKTTKNEKKEKKRTKTTRKQRKESKKRIFIFWTIVKLSKKMKFSFAFEKAENKTKQNFMFFGKVFNDKRAKRTKPKKNEKRQTKDKQTKRPFPNSSTILHTPPIPSISPQLLNCFSYSLHLLNAKTSHFYNPTKNKNQSTNAQPLHDKNHKYLRFFTQNSSIPALLALGNLSNRFLSSKLYPKMSPQFSYKCFPR
jgi:hypothetical protein